MGMNRTLKGFLRRYCNELSGLSTGNLRKLCDAARDNARLVEPLFLLAVEQGKGDYLASLSNGAWFQRDYERLLAVLPRYASMQEFLRSADAPKRYAAVLDAFEAQGDLLAADRRLNGLMRPRIAAALEQAGITRYAMCEALGLNKGNVYAYLAGDNSKVSNATARRMLDYALTCSPMTS
jgi:hypothetical protein